MGCGKQVESGNGVEGVEGDWRLVIASKWERALYCRKPLPSNTRSLGRKDGRRVSEWRVKRRCPMEDSR